MMRTIIVIVVTMSKINHSHDKVIIYGFTIMDLTSMLYLTHGSSMPKKNVFDKAMSVGMDIDIKSVFPTNTTISRIYG